MLFSLRYSAKNNSTEETQNTSEYSEPVGEFTTNSEIKTENNSKIETEEKLYDETTNHDQCFFGKFNNKNVYITKIIGPIDTETIKYYLENCYWSEQDVQELAECLFRIGIIGKIQVKENVYLQLFGPEFILKKDNSKDPMGVGDTLDKRFSKIEKFQTMKTNIGKSFVYNIEDFLVQSSFSLGRQLSFSRKQKDSYRSQLKIKESKIPISFVYEYFIDVPEGEAEKIQQLIFEVESQNLLKEENIFLKLFGHIFGDSTHFLGNLGKKDKEIIINTLKYLGYINAKIIDKTFIYNNSPEEKNVGIVYSIALGKKATLKKIILKSEHISISTQNKIKALLNEKLLNSMFFFRNIKEINNILAPLQIKCIKTKIFRKSDEDFDLYIWCDYNNSDKFYQNIKFQNFPVKSSKLFKLASSYGIQVGAIFEDKKINDFCKALEDISGRKISFNQEQDRGVIANFSAAPKPPIKNFVENILRANPEEGIVVSIFQWQWFFLYNQFFQIKIIPEVRTDVTIDLFRLFSELKIGTKIETTYFFENKSKIIFSLLPMLRVKKMLEYLSKPNEIKSFLMIDANLSYKMEEYDFFIRYHETSRGNINNLFYNDPFKQLDFSFFENTYVLKGGIEFEKTIRKNEFLQNLRWDFNLIRPSEGQTTGYKASADYSIGYNLGPNILLTKIMGAMCLKDNSDALIETRNVYRIPGYLLEQEPQVFKNLLYVRTVLLTEIWDSSNIFARMLSLYIGPIINIAFGQSYNNLQNYHSGIRKFQIIGNAGFMIVLDLMGTMGFFIYIGITRQGNITIDFGVMFRHNPFTQSITMEQFN